MSDCAANTPLAYLMQQKMCEKLNLQFKQH